MVESVEEHRESGLVSVEDYLAMEECSEVRHEYVAGMLYAMTGGTPKHNRICINVLTRLLELNRDAGCDVFMSDVKLHLEDIRYYPDVMVVCDPADDDARWRTRPCLLVEVMSPGSTMTDQREKLLAYRGIDSVKAYLIVHQESRRVERHFRDENGEWRRADHVHDSYIPVPCPEGRLTLAGIYEGL